MWAPAPAEHCGLSARQRGDTRSENGWSYSGDNNSARLLMAHRQFAIFSMRGAAQRGASERQ